MTVDSRGKPHSVSVGSIARWVELEYVEDSGWFLYYYESDMRGITDFWFESEEQALEEARETFGIPVDAWVEVEG